MFYPGLVSISFRDHSPEEIASEAIKCNLRSIEWGSDIHAPRQDSVRMAELDALQTATGLRCCSYGTYFRLGFTPIEELSEYICAAKKLGSNTLRIWAGRKKAFRLFRERTTGFLRTMR